jgi:DNA-binding response OmpR family regulator
MHTTKKTILIVEDDARVAKAMGIRLQAAGYAIQTASDGGTAMRLAENDPPDLIIADIFMPMGAGFALAYRLRQSGFKVPIIFVTGSRDPKVRKAAEEFGAVAFIEKPYEPEALLAAVARGVDATAVAARMTEPPPASPPLSTKKTILIVEDDEKIALSLSVRLKAANYEVEVAADAATALAAGSRHRPDLIILDITMPGDSGFVVAEQVRQHAASPPPILFLTASKMPGFRERAKELGAAGYVEKPFDGQTLLAAIRQALGQPPQAAEPAAEQFSF